MNPIYKFHLYANTESQRAHPLYRDDVAIEYALEQNQQFYRAKLSGKLTFAGPDYSFISNKPFDTRFGLTLYISYDGGATWAVYWNGRFWKTDCEFDDDSKTVTVTATVNDAYNDVLSGLEKEYNIIDLAPEINSVRLDKRPMIQIYVPGQTSIGCFLSGMWWEQECNAVSNESTLVNTYHFAKILKRTVLEITQSGAPILPGLVISSTEQQADQYSIFGGGFVFTLTYESDPDPEGGYFYAWRIKQNNVTLWEATSNTASNRPYSKTLEAVGGGATGPVTIYIHDIAVYGRYVTDIGSYPGITVYDYPNNDIVENNRNYSHVTGYAITDTIYLSTLRSNTPTKWGIYQPGIYYVSPADIATSGIAEAFPVARSSWGQVSVWFAFSSLDWTIEPRWRKTYTLKDAYTLSSVISRLLSMIAPNVTHVGSETYSRFLYGENPITHITQRLIIAPKSNIINADYDQPAQKAMLTLKSVLDMLRDCFRCYWFIDDANRFRIEHISWFMNGGTYPPGQPVIGVDLTKQIVTRNGKPWATGQNQYKFDKPEMAARYQFGWMDDVTELFNGYPIDIISQYVNPNNIENIDVAKFTSDVDYILLNPSEISNDGFVLFAGQAASETAGENLVFNNETTKEFQFDLSPFVGQQVVFHLQCNTGRTIFVSQVSDGQKTAIGQLQTYTSSPQQFSTLVLSGATHICIESSASLNLTITLVDFFAQYPKTFKLPYVNFTINEAVHVLQNAWVSFMYLQQYYAYDMPAGFYRINGVDYIAHGIKKMKTQSLSFPVFAEPELQKLIKTQLGNGTIEKLSVNLSSRNAKATLKFDTV